MEANEFIEKLKEETTEKDAKTLDKVYDSYKAILSNLATKDRSLFALNVLCTLCRNLDKAPKWREHVDCRSLLNLSIDSVRETRAMAANDRMKTLACVFHIHRFVIRQTKPVPPELVLKISFMPFEADSKHLLNEYSKTYWTILVDRMCYIEKIKHIPISKLLPKLTEDINKTIEIYDTVQFCSTVLLFLVKKLHYLYTNCSAEELNKTYVEIFKNIASKDLKVFRNLSKEENFDIYVKLNECLYIIVENSSNINLQNFALDKVVVYCLATVEHCPDFFHCFQTFYINCFHYIFTSEDETDRRTRLKCLLLSMETTEKIGYETALKATYPFLNNCLRVFVEYNITNIATRPWMTYFDIETQEITLKIILILMKKLKYCKQLLKCENCNIKTGLHDSLRTSFQLKNILSSTLSQKLVIKDLKPIIVELINKQNKILIELNELGCTNFIKCYRKNQADIHNSAISLHKAKYYEFSIKLFDLYLESELNQTSLDHKNISRALYNKSICSLDSKLYKNALVDTYLSLVFSKNDGLNSEKHMSLVMEVKSKELKSKSEIQDGDLNELQIFSVVDAVKYAMDNKLYGDLGEVVKDLPFEVLLRHEFKMYAKLWPSLAPIGGVWKSLYELYCGIHDHWTNVKKEAIIWCLFEVVLETAFVVRTIHSDYYETTVYELLKQIEQIESTPDLTVVQTALMFLNTEYSLAASSKKYGWKPSEQIQTSDPNQIPANRTIPQEHSAIVQALKAVDVLTDLMEDLHKVSKPTLLRFSLAIYQAFVYNFLHLSKTVQALQLAYVCCRIAVFLDDSPTYIMNAGNILYHMATPHSGIEEILTKCAKNLNKLSGKDHFETSVIFICDSAIYFTKCGKNDLAAKLVQSAQAKILSVFESDPGINVEMALGRLMEAQLYLCRQADRQTVLTEVYGVQRHYLNISSNGGTWSARRSYTLRLRYHIGLATQAAAVSTRKLYQLRRAAAAAAAGLGAAGAARRALLYAHSTDVHSGDDAQFMIDSRLKHILGLQATNDINPHFAPKAKEIPTLRDIEPMRDVFTKNQTSPTIPCLTIPAFRVPQFFLHKNCDCYACTEPLVFVISCKTAGLEAAFYFRAGEIDIARNYFDGAVKLIELSQSRLRNMKKVFRKYEEFIVGNVLDGYMKDLKEIEVEILIEMSFFEIKCQNYDAVDENIVHIHEIIKEISVDKYLKNEIMNLMVASAELRKVVKKSTEIESLEEDFDKLQISGKEMQKTPDIKVKIPKDQTAKVVKDEELFKKRKVIKLNLDEESDDFEAPKVTLKSAFKVPVPKLSKASLELATPVATRTIPKLIITQPENTPTTKKADEFFTPSESPEQFFTPITSVKTYTKKNLRQNIIKKLEDEFSTPKQTDKHSDRTKLKKEQSESDLFLEVPKRTQKVNKNHENLKPNENTDLNSKIKAKKDTLRRATSPGKLPKATNPKGKSTKMAEKATSPGKVKNVAGRSLRRRPDIVFSLDDDKK